MKPLLAVGAIAVRGRSGDLKTFQERLHSSSCGRWPLQHYHVTSPLNHNTLSRRNGLGQEVGVVGRRELVSRANDDQRGSRYLPDPPHDIEPIASSEVVKDDLWIGI